MWKLKKYSDCRDLERVEYVSRQAFFFKLIYSNLISGIMIPLNFKMVGGEQCALNATWDMFTLLLEYMFS